MRGDPATNFEGGSQYGRENAARPFLALPMTLAPSPRTLTTGLRWAEAPFWVERLGGLLFSDTKANTIYHLAPPEAEGEWTRSVFLRPSGYTGPHPPGMEHGSNGLHLDADGQIVLCSHGERGVFALNEERWTKRPLALRYRGLRLNSPNDVTQHASGALYFTDPAYGLDEGVDDPRRAICKRGVYLTDPMTGSVVLATAEVEDPNGIGFSPDGRAPTSAAPKTASGTRFPWPVTACSARDASWLAPAISPPATARRRSQSGPRWRHRLVGPRRDRRLRARWVRKAARSRGAGRVQRRLRPRGRPVRDRDRPHSALRGRSPLAAEA